MTLQGVVAEALVRAWPDRDLERLYREHGARLWRALVGYAGDSEIANDAVAEAFAQALGRRDELRDPLRWVWRVAFRVAAGELKDRRRRGSGQIERAAEVVDPDVGLLDVLGRLSPKQRAALVLHYYGGYPTKEIAAIVGSSAATVRVHLSQGRRRLRRILEEQRD
jgi:RNA polymerase sigma-70 factor (ECF subfamily)